MQFSKSAIFALLAGVVSLAAAQESEATGTVEQQEPTGTAPSQASGSVLMHVISVGSADGALTFSPNSLKAAVGDMVQFQFWPKNHSVVQSTFDKPCVPKPEEDGAKAFFSGYLPVKMTDSNMPTWTIMINDTKPIWYYCSQGQHCQGGMVGVINPPEDTPERTVEAYAAAAKDVETAYDPNTAPEDDSSEEGSDSGSETESGPTTLTTAVATGASGSSPQETGNATLGSGSMPAFYSSPSLTVFFAALAAAALMA